MKTVLATTAILIGTTSAFTFGTKTAEPPKIINANPAIKIAASGMNLLKPIFAAEAGLQAALLGAVSQVDKAAVAAQLKDAKRKNKFLIYTYGLSPFSSEALSILDKTGYEYTNIKLGEEWFLLGGEGSEMRVALSKEVENGATSLPKIFISGECIGGCAELATLAESGELDSLLKKAKVAKRKN
mmetsp:Transcript_30691/g.62716  ORF Transcript_30691/g.62716 Transcript_30691/m.62716 type:complete len:185 (-) Transcript_30691:34-588(-)